MKTRHALGLLALALTGCTQLNVQPFVPASDSGATQQTSSEAKVMVPETISGAVILGSNNARVTMLLFTNPDCAYCKEFNNDLMPDLQSEFIDVGTVKVEIVSLPLKKYPSSERSAKTMICAATSESGASITDDLFNGRSSFPALRDCLTDKNGTVQRIYNKQQELIRSLDVSLIPTYFLNGKKFTGLPDYADLRGQIEEAMQR